MFSYFLDILSTTIGAVLPIYYTWKTLQSKKTRPLVPLSKYWAVFGVMTVIESLANLIYLPYLIPGYSLLKFVAVVYVYLIGYERIFNNILSPFFKEYEPTGMQMMSTAQQMGPKMISYSVNLVLNQVAASRNHRYMVQNEDIVNGQLQNRLLPAIQHRGLEEQEDDEELQERSDDEL